MKSEYVEDEETSSGKPTDYILDFLMLRHSISRRRIYYLLTIKGDKCTVRQFRSIYLNAIIMGCARNKHQMTVVSNKMGELATTCRFLIISSRGRQSDIVFSIKKTM